jgi:hypothetical protein
VLQHPDFIQQALVKDLARHVLHLVFCSAAATCTVHPGSHSAAAAAAGAAAAAAAAACFAVCGGYVQGLNFALSKAQGK